MIDQAITLNNIAIELVKYMDLDGAVFASRAASSIVLNKKSSMDSCKEILRARSSLALFSVGDPLDVHPFDIRLISPYDTQKTLQALRDGPSSEIVVFLVIGESPHLRPETFQKNLSPDLISSMILYNYALIYTCMARLSGEDGDPYWNASLAILDLSQRILTKLALENEAQVFGTADILVTQSLVFNLRAEAFREMGNNIESFQTLDRLEVLQNRLEHIEIFQRSAVLFRNLSSAPAA